MRRSRGSRPTSVDSYSLQELFRPKFLSIASSRSSYQNTGTSTEHILEGSSYEENDSGNSATFGHQDATKNQSKYNITRDNCYPLATSPSEKPYSERGVVERLGTFLVFTNIAAFILFLTALSSVIFLWSGGEENKNWRRIMINGWIGQAVTLSSYAIRLAIATQAGAAVAMLASISVEDADGASLQVAPALSIARYTNTGPLMSVLTFWKNRNVPIFLLVISLGLTTTMAQYSSTLLLWDVHSGSVKGFQEEENVPIGIGLQDYVEGFSRFLTSSPNYFASSQTNYPAFAEWSEEPLPLPSYITDTGPTIRALLPVADETRRNTMLEYTGAASLFDARVVCVRPNFTEWEITENGEHESSFFTGNIVAPTLPKELVEILHFNMSTDGKITKIPFHCSMEQFSYLQKGRSYRICLPGFSTVKTVFGGLVNTLDPTVNKSTARSQYLHSEDLFTARSGNDSWRVEYGRMILFLDVEQNGPQATDYNGFAELNKDLIEEGRDAWLDITSAGNPTAGRVSVTTCYDALYQQAFTSRLTHIQEFNVTADRNSNHTEPQAIWDPKERRFDTAPLRKQLNALKSPLLQEQRGIFGLSKAEIETALMGYSSEFSPHNVWSHIAQGSETKLTGYNYSTTPTYSFLYDLLWSPQGFEKRQQEVKIDCLNCNISSYLQLTSTEELELISLPALPNSLFTDVMVETENPALAWQALTTFAIRAAYYDWLPSFSTNGSIVTTHNVLCQRPKQYRGFSIVMVNLWVHYILIVIAFVWFCKVTKHTIINNAWQVVATLGTPQIGNVFEGVKVVDDKSVERSIKKSNRPERRYRIGDNI